MSCVTKSKDWVDYLESLTPICVAIFAGYIGLRQAKISRDKLRLDLYNRRFDIYEKTLLFYQSITNYDGSEHEPFSSKHRDFIKAMKESQFLFDPKSGIYKTLLEMHEDAFKIIGFKRHGQEVSRADPVVFSQMHTDMQNALTGFAFQIDAIEKAIAPYLNFHKTVV